MYCCSRNLKKWILLVVSVAFFHSAVAQSRSIQDPLYRPALKSQRVMQSFLVDVTRAGERLIAVGERGIIILSDDHGRTWRQARVPVAVTLTTVTFPTPQSGWAAGHAGTILHTQDGGESWIVQLDGVSAAKLALQAAEATQSISLRKDAERLMADGPDKPFLSLYFKSDKVGFAVGAYGLAFRTEDAGVHWLPFMANLENPKGLHFYAITGSTREGTLYLAGEQGILLRSLDNGVSFSQIQPPYQGSYFALASQAQRIIVAGLRGNAFWSDDQGNSWNKVEVPEPVSFNSMATMKDGTLIFVNQAGHIFASHDHGQTLQALPTPLMPPLTAVVQSADGTMMGVGAAGTVRFGDSGNTQTGHP